MFKKKRTQTILGDWQDEWMKTEETLKVFSKGTCPQNTYQNHTRTLA